MKTPTIYKYSATGNDFVLIDLLRGKIECRNRAGLARALCHRRFGIGADGLVILEKTKNLDFKWDFYNSDGSVAEMCGNAARAVSLHASRSTQKSQLRFETLAGTIETRMIKDGKLAAELIEVTMPAVGEARWSQLAPLGDFQLHYDFIHSGVPHAVVKIPNFKNRHELKNWARSLKALPVFGPSSTNVTFIRALNGDRAQSVTFERGVENFTLSCGTGAVAAAYSLLRGEEGRTVTIQVPGGRLQVKLMAGRPRLIGPAQFIGEISPSEHFFKECK